MDSWYEKWFNSPEYISVYKHRNSAEAEKLVDLILAKINPPPVSKVIDLACGYGRHSISFAERGFDVTGIDISKTLIEIAKADSFSKNLNIDFINQDLSTLEISNKYFIALNLFTSFGYYKEDEKNFNIFSIANGQLINGGYFVFDFLNSGYVRSNLESNSTEIFNDIKIEQHREIADDVVHKTIILTKGSVIKKYDEYVKLYNPEILSTEIVKRGFKIIGLYGDYNGSSFNIEESQRFLIICQKAF